jgi:hypothetical protein
MSTSGPAARSRALLVVGLGAILLVVAVVVGGPLASSRVAAQATAEGGAGQTLSVSKATDLDPAGEVVTVTGSGYDDSKGIYVSFCVLPPPGQKPTPCAGGIDLTGSGGSTIWISSDPPAYAKGLTTPFGPGG